MLFLYTNVVVQKYNRNAFTIGLSHFLLANHHKKQGRHGATRILNCGGESSGHMALISVSLQETPLPALLACLLNLRGCNWSCKRHHKEDLLSLPTTKITHSIKKPLQALPSHPSLAKAHQQPNINGLITAHVIFRIQIWPWFRLLRDFLSSCISLVNPLVLQPCCFGLITGLRGSHYPTLLSPATKNT